MLGVVQVLRLFQHGGGLVLRNYAHPVFISNHDVARGLEALFATGKVALGDFESLIAARSFDASAEQFADFAALETYLDYTGGRVMRLAIQVLGGNADLAREAALAFGLAGLIRSLPFHAARHKLYVPLDLLAAADLTPDQFFAASMLMISYGRSFS